MIGFGFLGFGRKPYNEISVWKFNLRQLALVIGIFYFLVLLVYVVFIGREEYEAFLLLQFYLFFAVPLLLIFVVSRCPNCRRVIFFPKELNVEEIGWFREKVTFQCRLCEYTWTKTRFKGGDGGDIG